MFATHAYLDGCRAPGMNSIFNLMQMQEQYNVNKINISLCFIEHQKTPVSRRHHENHENCPCSSVFDL